MAPMLELDRVVVGYGDGPPVLREISIVVGSGQMLAVTGPSGAGKTTLLRTGAGQLRPTPGVVTVGGEPLRDRDHAVALRVVLIAQHNGLATILTAGENLQVVLVANGIG